MGAGNLGRLVDAVTTGPEETWALARAVASGLAVGDVLILSGDLGAGKTCFTQGLAKGLGVDERVTSPTFTLANRYQGRLELNHLDVYRLNSVAETVDLDLPELLEAGVTVVEWGDRIKPVLPDEHLVIHILFGDGAGVDADNDRLFRFSASGAGWADRMPRLTETISQWRADS